MTTLDRALISSPVAPETPETGAPSLTHAVSGRATDVLDLSSIRLSDILAEGITTIDTVEDFQRLMVAAANDMSGLGIYIGQCGRIVLKNLEFQTDAPSLRILRGFLGMVDWNVRAP